MAGLERRARQHGTFTEATVSTDHGHDQRHRRGNRVVRPRMARIQDTAAKVTSAATGYATQDTTGQGRLASVAPPVVMA